MYYKRKVITPNVGVFLFLGGVSVKQERRTYEIDFEVRSDEGQSPKIVGYAAVFDSKSEDLGGFREIIKPGAFKNALNDDVRALFNHDPNYVLGRNKAGTLSLAEDERGLKIVIDPPDTSWASDLKKSMSRGDINQMSFGFITNSDRWGLEDGETIRELVDVSLFDVSVVTYPAYTATDASVRSTKDVYKDYANSIQAKELADKQAEQERSLKNKKLKLKLLESEV